MGRKRGGMLFMGPVLWLEERLWDVDVRQWGIRGTGWGIAVETGMGGRRKWEITWGTQRNLVWWHGWRELQVVRDLKGIGMVLCGSLRMSIEKCGEPECMQRVYSRGAHFAWHYSFLKEFLLLYFYFDLYYWDRHSV